MLRQRFEIVKQNNNLKQYIPTADSLGYHAVLQTQSIVLTIVQNKNMRGISDG